MGQRIVNRVTCLAAVLAACCWASAAMAQNFPSRPVTLVVPFPAGSTTDLVGRILSDELAKSLGQNVVVDNRGGAGGTIRRNSSRNRSRVPGCRSISAITCNMAGIPVEQVATLARAWPEGEST